MKKIIMALACLASVTANAETYSTYPESPGTAAGFVTSVVEYNPGSGAYGDGAIQSNVLGAPNGNYLSLGKLGNAVFKVGPNPLKADGTPAIDIYVYEAGWWDSFDVYISANSVSYTKLVPTTTAKASGGSGSWVGFNIDGQVDTALSYPYVKVVDTSSNPSTIPGTDGADIDGIMITHAAAPTGDYVMYDTDMYQGKTYNLYQDKDSGAVGVKVITATGAVSYVPFSSDGSLLPIAVSVQSDVNGDSINDIDVLVTRKSDNAQLNIYRDFSGALLKVVDNSAIK
ncbi:hypothetical protein [Pseudomonas canadensis]|uniref:hypothetical protein n=1 Tax=Pseudomonas canadensis TaxID=915099 RepID=UPI00281115AC|nr:hypothetical protein [Pseudomonas canadensis]